MARVRVRVGRRGRLRVSTVGPREAEGAFAIGEGRVAVPCKPGEG